MSQSSDRQVDLIEELRGTMCPCGAKKERAKTFCSRCYFALPGDMRRALYRRIGEGYEEAYDAAIDHLQGSGS